MGPAFGEHGGTLFFFRAFEIKRYIKRYVKMPCKWVSLSIGAPLGNLEGDRLPRLFERKGNYIWVAFLDPENIKVLCLGTVRNLVKGQGSHELISDPGAQRACLWVLCALGL